MQESAGIWTQWLEQFGVVEDVDGSTEIPTALQLEEVEQEINFVLPEDYKKFCEVFGTCSFFQGRRVYSPNIRLSENLLYPVREGYSAIYETDVSSLDIPAEIPLEIERMLTGAGLVFSDDITATIYIFDLESYQGKDKSCDIWLTSGEGELNSFSCLGRSFYNFFLSFCIEIDNSLLGSENDVISLPQKKKLLRRFNSNEFMDF